MLRPRSVAYSIPRLVGRQSPARRDPRFEFVNSRLRVPFNSTTSIIATIAAGASPRPKHSSTIAAMGVQVLSISPRPSGDVHADKLGDDAGITRADLGSVIP
jgi:hypothetical protein